MINYIELFLIYMISFKGFRAKIAKKKRQIALLPGVFALNKFNSSSSIK